MSLVSIVNTGLYVAMGGVAGNGLVQKLPKLVGGELSGVQSGDVAVDAILFCVAAVQLAKMAGGGGQPMAARSACGGATSSVRRPTARRQRWISPESAVTSKTSYQQKLENLVGSVFIIV